MKKIIALSAIALAAFAFGPVDAQGVAAASKTKKECCSKKGKTTCKKGKKCSTKCMKACKAKGKDCSKGCGK